jgi:Mg2+-importing ATPase
LRPLLVFADAKDTTFPQVATSRQLGYDIPLMPTIRGVVGPPKMTPERAKVLEEAIKKAEVLEVLEKVDALVFDKTGTLTEGVVQFHSAVDVDGNESEKVFLYAYLNAFYETGFKNPIDQAIRNYRPIDISSYQKQDEVPYDFVRKRLSILVSKGKQNLIITKGAFQNVLDVCSFAEISEGRYLEIDKMQDQIQQRFEKLSHEGFRILGIAYRDMHSLSSINKDHEIDMTFLGFLILFDPTKPGIMETLGQLKHLGVSLKIITGDNSLVAANVSQQVELLNPHILTGRDLHRMSDEALLKQVNEVDVFAEVEPNHKERIILALKKAGHVVGYMGDGINDASALHTADVGISVDSAVDVPKRRLILCCSKKTWMSLFRECAKEGEPLPTH